MREALNRHVIFRIETDAPEEMDDYVSILLCETGEKRHIIMAFDPTQSDYHAQMRKYAEAGYTSDTEQLGIEDLTRHRADFITKVTLRSLGFANKIMEMVAMNEHPADTLEDCLTREHYDLWEQFGILWPEAHTPHILCGIAAALVEEME